MSATSADLAAARVVATGALVEAGCLPRVQEHLPPDYRSLGEVLRAAIESCDAVICLVGHAFGAAPAEQPGDGAERRSFTQIEYDTAVALGRPVFVLMAEEGFAEPVLGESDRDRELQRRHREQLCRDHKYEPFSDLTQLMTRLASVILQIQLLSTAEGPVLRIPGREEGLELQPSKLLLAHNRFLGLLGRETELALLESFRDGPEPFGWIVISGDGGVGKTRLGIEFADRSRTLQWEAGLLDATDLARFEESDLHAWVPDRDTLIVVDYAGGKGRTLAPLLERGARIALEQGSDVRARLRLVLLERDASDDRGSWLDELLRTGEGDVRSTIRTTHRGVMPLGPPSVGAGPIHQMTEAFLRAAFEAWEQFSGLQAPPFPEFAEADWYLIQRNTMGRPLYLQMAAVSACEAGDARRLPLWVRGDLLSAAVSRERDYIEQACRAERGLAEVLERLSALLCLTGVGVRRDAEWIPLVRQEIEAIGWDGLRPRVVDQRLASIFTALDTLGEEETPVSPDILAGAFAATILLQHPTSGWTELRRAVDLGSVVAWLKLIRLVQDLHGVEGFEDVSGWLERLAEHRPYDELLVVGQQLPERTQALQPFAMSLYEHLVTIAETMERPDDERAWLLIRWSSYLESDGARESRERALDAARAAIALADDLVTAGGAEHRPLQATGYHYLGRALDALHRPERLEAVQRAVELREVLAAENWDEFGAELGKSLNNLSNALDDAGRHDEALDVIRRAATIAEEFASHAWERHAPEVARSLNNLARRLLALGRPTEALPHAARSVSIRQDLVRRWPDEFQADFGLSLSTLSQVHAELGDFDEAFRVLRRESRNRLPLLRALAARDPVEYGPRLQEELDRLVEARWTHLGRKTAPAPSELNIVPSMVAALESELVGLALRGKLELATRRFAFVLEMWRALAEREPAFRIHLVRGLNNLAAVLEMHQEAGPARPLIAEAFSLLDELPDDDPEVLLERGRVCDTGSRVERRLGEIQAAIALARESSAILAGLREREGRKGEEARSRARDHAEIRQNLARLLAEEGLIEEAAEVAAAAFLDLEPHRRSDDLRLRSVLSDLADWIVGFGRREEGAAVAMEAAGLRLEAAIEVQAVNTTHEEGQ